MTIKRFRYRVRVRPTVGIIISALLYFQPAGGQQGYPQGPAPGQPMPNYPGAPGGGNPPMPGYGSAPPSGPVPIAVSIPML